MMSKHANRLLPGTVHQSSLEERHKTFLSTLATPYCLDRNQKKFGKDLHNSKHAYSGYRVLKKECPRAEKTSTPPTADTLGGKESEDEDEEGEESEGVAKVTKKKRKWGESNAKCDRCMSFKSDFTCIIDDGQVKCRKCRNDKQGCYWGGRTKDGTRQKPRIKKAMIEKLGPLVESESDAPITGSSSVVIETPPSNLSSKQKGKARDTEDALAELKEVLAEKTRVANRILVLNHLLQSLEQRETSLKNIL